MDSLTLEITSAIQRLDDAFCDEDHTPSPQQDTVPAFRVGSDSLVTRAPNTSQQQTSSGAEEDGLSLRL